MTKHTQTNDIGTEKQTGFPAGFLSGHIPAPVKLVGLTFCAILISALTGCAVLPKTLGKAQPVHQKLVTVHKSNYQDIDRTCAALQEAIEAEGLRCLNVRNTTQSVIKGGIPLDRQVRVIEWCKAQYAHDMLKGSPEVSVLLPCAFGVYRGDDGTVYVSALNMELVGKLLGGAVADVMGEQVSRNQAAILTAHTH